MRILIPDTWHFHRRNFAPLYDHLASARIETHVERTRRRWWKRHGDYAPFAAQLSGHARRLEGLGPEALIAIRHRDIPLIDVARSEFLCRALPRWIAGAGPRDDLAIVDRALHDEIDRRELLLCFAAAIDWIDFWSAKLGTRSSFTHALAFSGSYIYTRALQEVARARGVRGFALETFFTGNDFYLEERWTPLSNRSQLQDPDYYRHLLLPTDADRLDRLRAEAQLRFRTRRNKNVRADALATLAPPFGRNASGTVLVLGQVLNDFSLIETALPEMSSIAVYRRLIEGLLESSNLNIIFKAHPWERRRPNLMAPVTLQRIRAWHDELPAQHRARVKVLEREPLAAVLPYADQVVGLSSQGLVEAAAAGLKPIQIGMAFFGGHGFTHNRTLDDGLIGDLAEGRIEGRLTLAEYRALEDFMVRALLLHLVSDRPEGVAKIGARLADPGHIPALDEVSFTEEEPRPRLSELIGNIAANPLALLRFFGPGRSRRP
jgi:hypothetical protein